MKIEIWSDVMCPFCFIGKHRFENALEKLPFKNEIEIVWKSYLLDANLEPIPGENMHDRLAKAKQLPMDQIKQMHDYVEKMGATADIQFDFEHGVPANTINAHKLIHLAQKHGKGSAMKEVLFHAHFEAAQDLNDLIVLKSLAKSIGLEESEINETLQSESVLNEVLADVHEGAELGVPFFVFNRKYAISGAQEEHVFIDTLEKSFQEWLQANPNPNFEIIEGKACSVDGKCE